VAGPSQPPPIHSTPTVHLPFRAHTHSIIGLAPDWLEIMHAPSPKSARSALLQPALWAIFGTASDLHTAAEQISASFISRPFRSSLGFAHFPAASPSSSESSALDSDRQSHRGRALCAMCEPCRAGLSPERWVATWYRRDRVPVAGRCLDRHPGRAGRAPGFRWLVVSRT